MTEVAVKDTQTVKPGDVLLRLDPANAIIAIAEAEADLAAARRRFRQAVAGNDALSAQVDARTADIAQPARSRPAEAEFDKARSISTPPRARRHRRGLGRGADRARKAFRRRRGATARRRDCPSRSEPRSAQGELAANQALVGGSTEETDPAVLAAKAKLEAARLDLARTVIRAPIDGTITRRQVQLGQRVAQGQPVMSIVPIDKVYVDANFKERQLRRVRVGQPATSPPTSMAAASPITARLPGLAGGTGASMALIPAQNATGNWIKVVQRLPVRIELDPKELAEHPLRVGLSTEVEIDISGN